MQYAGSYAIRTTHFLFLFPLTLTWDRGAATPRPEGGVGGDGDSRDYRDTRKQFTRGGAHDHPTAPMRHNRHNALLLL